MKSPLPSLDRLERVGKARVAAKPRAAVGGAGDRSPVAQWVEGFVQERCRVAALESVAASDIWAEFSQWCAQRGLRTPSRTALGRQLRALGFWPRHSHTIIWHGLGLSLKLTGRRLSLKRRPRPATPWRVHQACKPSQSLLSEAGGASTAVLGYLDDCCAHDPGWFEASGDLWDSYRAWCRHNGTLPVTRTAFGRTLNACGLLMRNQRISYWYGIRLKQPQPCEGLRRLSEGLAQPSQLHFPFMSGT